MTVEIPDGFLFLQNYFIIIYKSMYVNAIT